MLGLTIICGYQLLHPSRDRFSYGKWWRFIIFITIVVAVIALFNRTYLGYRVEQSSYIKCVKESRTSSKSSWRVYAKHEKLCSSSSYIVGD